MTPSSAAAQPSKISIEDLYQLGWIEEPAISPDGRLVAFVRVSVDRSANRYRRTIWLASTDAPDRPLRRLTAGPRNDTTPCWSPDGQQLAFTSDRDGERPQIYLIALHGGEARRITSMPQGASQPAWRPDGQALAFLARCDSEQRTQEDLNPPQTAQTAFEQKQEQARLAQQEAERIDPRIIRKLPYRTGTSYRDRFSSHVYLIELPANDDSEPGKPRRLTDGDDDYGPPVWSIDGQTIFSTSGRDPEADTLFGDDDVVRIPVLPEGRAAAERLTAAGGSYDSPRPSPDGRWVAARRRDQQRPLVTSAAIVAIPLSGGAQVDLTSSSDLNADSYRWLPDSSGVLFSAAWWGEQAIYRARLDGHGSIQPASTPAEARFVNEFDSANDGTIAFVAGTGSNPCELFCWRADGSELRLTNLSERVLSQRHLASFEELIYQSPDGEQVQGWVLYPPDFDPQRTYPLAIHIHGGPYLMWAPGFRSMWHELQANAARGYITFFCNPRGSDGYGSRWRGLIDRNWGSAATDILAGIDLLVARGHVDTKRIAVTGGSYGGYMTAWLLGHDQRFCCAVAARGVYDLISFHGTSDAHELIEFVFEGMPWEVRDLLWEQSPLSHAHKITTPLLILHAELDYRVPISQAEQLFSNLRRRKIDVELIRYPREGHELTRAGEPDHRADHMRRTLAWFDRYCHTEEHTGR
ncbi:MAG: S9 family peptidase [Roseiflexaceae bacterium]